MIFWALGNNQQNLGNGEDLTLLKHGLSFGFLSEIWIAT